MHPFFSVPEAGLFITAIRDSWPKIDIPAQDRPPKSSKLVSSAPQIILCPTFGGALLFLECKGAQRTAKNDLASPLGLPSQEGVKKRGTGSAGVVFVCH